MEEVTIEEIWEIEELAGKTVHPIELMAIQLLVEKKRKLYKEQEWEKYHYENSWEATVWSEPPVGYKALQTVQFIMWDVSPEGKDKPPTDWSGNPLDENLNPIPTPDTGK